jgi:glycosyltransferase involved in cell wall biosynthesis
MKVLMISSSYPQDAEDWRARFISDLVYAMAHRGRVQLYLFSPPGETPSSVITALPKADSLWLKRLMDQGGLAHIFRSGGLHGLLTAGRFLLKLRKTYIQHKDVDIIHVNWLQNALPLWGIRKPTVISVLGSDYGFLRIPGMVPSLRAVIRERECILAPNADWMEKLLREHFADIADIHPIPFGVKDMWFNVSKDMRPQTRRKWIAVTRITERKIGPLFSWGEGIFGDGHELHLLGPMQEQMSIPDWVHYHGPTSPDKLHDKWFPEASGLITLSLHDEGRPQVMLEAMAAGLPIIASDIPAHRNMIEHRETGWIVKTRKDFREALKWVALDEAALRIGSAASNWVRQNIGTWNDCAERYITAYTKLAGVKK